MNWTANNVYQYRDKTLVASNGQKYKWYTNGGGMFVLRLADKEFGLVIIETYNLNDLLSILNMMRMKPTS